MSECTKQLLDRLEREHTLSLDEYAALLRGWTHEDAAYAAGKARRACDRVYGDAVYIRGLIEVSNICRNDCLYCGIRLQP